MVCVLHFQCEAKYNQLVLGKQLSRNKSNAAKYADVLKFFNDLWFFHHYSFRLYANQTRNFCVPTPFLTHPPCSCGVLISWGKRGSGFIFSLNALFYYLTLVTEISDHKSPVNPRMGTLENWLRDDFHPQVPDVQIRIVRVIIISA